MPLRLCRSTARTDGVRQPSRRWIRDLASPRVKCPRFSAQPGVSQGPVEVIRLRKGRHAHSHLQGRVQEVSRARRRSRRCARLPLQ